MSDVEHSLRGLELIRRKGQLQREMAQIDEEIAERMAQRIKTLKRERDQARREVCRLLAELPTERLVVWNAARMPKDVAMERGWACFEEGT